MRDVAQPIAIELPSVLDANGAPAASIAYCVDSMKSIRPDAIIESTQPLRELAATYRVLVELRDGRRTAASAVSEISKRISREDWVETIVAAIVSSAEPASTDVQATPFAALKDELHARDLESILGRVDLDSRMPGVAERAANLVRDVLKRGRGEALDTGPTKSATALAVVEEAMIALLDRILADKEVRRLESSWRAIRFLVERASVSANVEVDIIDAPVEQVEGVFELLRERRGAESSRSRVDLVLLDFDAENSTDALDRIKRWGAAAAKIGAKIAVNGTSELVRSDSLSHIDNTVRQTASFEDIRSPEFASFRASDAETTFILNRFVAHAPHSMTTARLRDFPFFDYSPRYALGAVIFGSPVYAYAAICVRAFTRRGDWMRLAALPDRTLFDCPVQETYDRNLKIAITLEAIVGSSVQAAVSAAGLAILTCSANTDSIVLACAGADGKVSDATKPTV